MGRPVRRLRPALAALAIAAAAAGPAGAVPATGDRPAGTVSDWSHELNQNELPQWRRATAPPIPPRRWFPLVRSILHDAGVVRAVVQRAERPPVPAAPAEPEGAGGVAEPRRRSRGEFARSGLRWDVAYEVWAARKALDRGATVADPTADPTAYTRRLSLLDPRYRAEALREIRRIVPGLRGLPYVHLYTGSDEPVTILPRGRREAHRVRAPRWPGDFRRATGFALPDPAARPTTSAARGAALARVDALLRRPLPRDEGRPGGADQAARPGRAGEPERLRLHRRLHPVGLHPPRRRSPTSSRPTRT